MPLLQAVPLRALGIDDEADFADLPHYAALRDLLLEADVVYRVPTAGSPLARWDRVLLLNLGFWSPGEPDDVLEGRAITADVVAHRAWHHLAHHELGAASGSVEGLMLGEAIASAFDVYMLGMLLRTRPDAQMLDSQVPAMTATLEEAGLAEPAIEAFFARFAAQPAQCFESLRQLLFEVGVALTGAQGAEAAAEVLLAFDAHPMAPLLHHFELATWSLYARAHAKGDGAAATELHAQLVAEHDALDWLVRHWLP